MEELSYLDLNMGSILTMFLTARQNSTSDRGASAATSSKTGEAAESTVSLFPLANMMVIWTCQILSSLILSAC